MFLSFNLERRENMIKALMVFSLQVWRVRKVVLDAVVLPVQLEVKDTMDLKVVKENLVHLDQDLKDIQEIRCI